MTFDIGAGGNVSMTNDFLMHSDATFDTGGG